MKNLEIYNKFSAVPVNAQKLIGAGRLKGMTDINPMWRIKALTEVFGPTGIGWKYVIKEKQIIDGADGAKCAFVDIDLYIKHGGEWSEAIPGTGGSSFVSLESKGKYTSDECFKMALTDALSVACKALGVGADVYWSGGRTKYEKRSTEIQLLKDKYRAELIQNLRARGMDVNQFAEEKGLNKETSIETYILLLDELEKPLKQDEPEEPDKRGGRDGI